MSWLRRERVGVVPLHRPPRLRGKYLGRALSARWLTRGPLCAELAARVAAHYKVAPEQVALFTSETAGFFTLLVAERAEAVFCQDTWLGMISAAGLARKYPGVGGASLAGASRAGASEASGESAALALVWTEIGGAEDWHPEEKAHKKLDEALNMEGIGTTVLDSAHSWAPGPLRFEYRMTSFYPTKLVGGGEGGAVVCESTEKAETLRLYSQGVGGLKCHMTDAAAALNLEALELFPARVKETEEIWCGLVEKLDRLPFVKVKPQPVRPHLLQILQPNGMTVPETTEALGKMGVGAAWNFPMNGWVSVPCHGGLTSLDRARILGAIEKIWLDARLARLG